MLKDKNLSLAFKKFFIFIINLIQKNIHVAQHASFFLSFS